MSQHIATVEDPAKISSLLGRRWFFLAASAIVVAAPIHAQEIAPEERAAASAPEGGSDPLADGFRNPPAAARPRVWWHWLSGNVSREGITKDFEWMRRIGIAGAMMFDGDPGAPQIVPKRVTVLSNEWKADLLFAGSEARRLGLEFTMRRRPAGARQVAPGSRHSWA